MTPPTPEALVVVIATCMVLLALFALCAAVLARLDAATGATLDETTARMIMGFALALPVLVVLLPVLVAAELLRLVRVSLPEARRILGLALRRLRQPLTSGPHSS